VIVATYSGDTNNAGSIGTLTQVVNPLPATTTAVASSLNPSTSGQSVTFTATVTGGSLPTGTVNFTSNGAAISGCGAVALAAGNSQCSTSTLSVGSDAIVATYSGDSNNAGSSAALTQVVNPLPATTTTVACNPNPSLSGQSVMCAATVSGGSSPTGTVSFTSGGLPIGGNCVSLTLTSGGAQCTTSILPVGSDVIVATYSGDTNNAGSSGMVTQVVNSAGTPELQLSSSSYAVSIVGGQQGAVQLTVDVTGGTLFEATTFSCAGVGTNATCSFSPSSETTYPANVTMTINTTTDAARLQQKHSSPWAILTLMLPGLLLLPAGDYCRRRSVGLLAVFVLMLIFTMAGCGSSGSSNGSGNAQTYSAVVTASSVGVPNPAVVTISVTVTK
jgi:hypothetical protein